MANNILAPKPLSHNDISQLAAILEDNFQYHRRHQTLFPDEYITNFKTAVGLGFTAIMLDNFSVSTHQPNLNLFLNYFSTNKQNSITPITLAAAKIMDAGASIFRQQHPCPEHYNAFANTLKSAVQSGLLDSAEKREESQRFLQMLLRNSIF